MLGELERMQDSCSLAFKNKRMERRDKRKSLINKQAQLVVTA